ncbi:uncharacterized protein LOC134788449 [Penaeus indicus]|uniref:uncharacterized protein LOC134788449 n=1 Tax=Penaeus indicus TaxID=29960 RepID=UPI00300C195F
MASHCSVYQARFSHNFLKWIYDHLLRHQRPKQSESTIERRHGLLAEIWNCLRLKGVGEKHIRLIQDMYEGCQTQVRCAAGETEVFEVAVGLHQGSALSPFLYAIIIDCLTQEVQREAPWDMLFADDVVVCGNRRDEIEERLELWRGAMEDRGMKVSRQKTEYLKLKAKGEGGDNEGDTEVKLQGEAVAQVREFKYLGSIVEEDGGSDKEVTKRIQAGWGAWKKITGVMCDKNVPEKVKGRLYKTLVRPAMIYGMETVAVTKVQEERMQVAEMKMLRWSLGLTIMDKVRNETIRERVQVGELKKKLSETRLRWLGHVTRREESYVGKRVRRLTVGVNPDCSSLWCFRWSWIRFRWMWAKTLPVILSSEMPCLKNAILTSVRVGGSLLMDGSGTGVVTPFASKLTGGFKLSL